MKTVFPLYLFQMDLSFSSLFHLLSLPLSFCSLSGFSPPSFCLPPSLFLLLLSFISPCFFSLSFSPPSLPVSLLSLLSLFSLLSPASSLLHLFEPQSHADLQAVPGHMIHHPCGHHDDHLGLKLFPLLFKHQTRQIQMAFGAEAATKGSQSNPHWE